MSRTGPRDLDELLNVVPGIRKMRAINADLLRKLLDRSHRECTWCGQQVAKYRSKWCSDQCVENFKLRCDSAYQARIVLKRDLGICQICGRCTNSSENEFYEMSRKTDVWSNKEALNEIRRSLGYARGVWREVDHIVPVARGGGLCGPLGLRVTCGVCHETVTTELSAWLADQRNAQKNSNSSDKTESGTSRKHGKTQGKRKSRNTRQKS